MLKGHRAVRAYEGNPPKNDYFDQSFFNAKSITKNFNADEDTQPLRKSYTTMPSASYFIRVYSPIYNLGAEN